MKPNTAEILDPAILVENGVYFTTKEDLIQIKTIDRKENKIHFFNITEQCNVHIPLDRHQLVKKIR